MMDSDAMADCDFDPLAAMFGETPPPLPVADHQTASTDELGDLLGITSRAVTELGRRGVLQRHAVGIWPVRDSVRAYCAHLREQAAGRAGSTTLTAERVRVAREQADALEMKNAIQRREMLPAREVESAWGEVLRGVRAAMLALPSRIQERLPHLTRHDTSEIDHEVRAALEEAGNADA
jgi:phage terminase Nu1 subunit (DNA packaging protein)